jgi:hypothetical protein
VFPDSKLSEFLSFLSPQTVDHGKRQEFPVAREQRGLEADTQKFDKTGLPGNDKVHYNC